jgi:hypothetical protein
MHTDYCVLKQQQEKKAQLELIRKRNKEKADALAREKAGATASGGKPPSDVASPSNTTAAGGAKPSKPAEDGESRDCYCMARDSANACRLLWWWCTRSGGCITIGNGCTITTCACTGSQCCPGSVVTPRRIKEVCIALAAVCDAV